MSLPASRLAIAFLVLAAVAVPAFGHSEAPAGDDGLAADLQANLQRTGGQLVALAEAIPADQFGWAPSDEVRTVSEVFMHVVGTNLLLPLALGVAPAEGVVVGEAGPMALAGQWEAEVTSKEAVLEKLRASVDYAVAAIPQITDLDTEIDLFFPASKRAYLLIMVTHAHEHLGQAIAYARSLGVVPPWSQPAPAAEPATGDATDHGHEGHGGAHDGGEGHGDSH